MNYLKDLYNSQWIEIKINKKVIYIALLAYGVMWLKQYYLIQGIVVGYKYSQEEMKNPGMVSPGDGEPGKLDHSKDNPSL